MSDFWQGRRVLITGHTGFKGGWLSHWLLARGARVYGLALEPETEPSLFSQLDLARRMDHAILDVRNAGAVRQRVETVAPDVVSHLAAQPLVRRSYREPVETFSTNVMGTVHVLDALRAARARVAVVSITTDKVYENREWVHAYRETDRLGGHDPYSASKAACEIAISSYRLSYFQGSQVALASARAGNVIGGGDWAEDRIVPDFVRAGLSGQRLQVRNPGALRPWQHVLDPLAGYMLLAQQLYAGKAEVETSFNFGPDAAAQRRVSEVLSSAQDHWPVAWDDKSDPDAVHEANLLSLTTEKAQTILGWKPRWNFDQAVGQTISWYRAVSEGADPAARTTADIERFETGGA